MGLNLMASRQLFTLEKSTIMLVSNPVNRFRRGRLPWKQYQQIYPPLIPKAVAAACTVTSTPIDTQTVVTFSALQSCEWTVPNGVTFVRVLVVGGGSSSGASHKIHSSTILGCALIPSLVIRGSGNSWPNTFVVRKDG
jgi:hypothetical protein